MNGLAIDYQLVEQAEDENQYTVSVIRAEPSVSPNQLLQTLIEHVEVHSFQEKMPTMNDIFIAEVLRKE